MEVPQRSTNRTTIRSSNPTSGYLPKDRRMLSWKSSCTSMFIAALFRIAKTWNQPKCPQTDKWIKKMWYIYTMRYYSVINKDTLAFDRQCINMKGLLLNEGNQSVKERHCVSPLHLYQMPALWQKLKHWIV